jgi:ABC-type phosphate transport system substrate-binding protein
MSERNTKVRLMTLRLVHVLAGPALALLACAAAPPAPAVAQEFGFVVIVNQANPVTSLSLQQLADIFMRRTAQWADGGNAVHPVDQPAVAAVRDVFSRAVHGRPAAAIASYWGQQLFSGRAVPPPQRPNDRAVIAFVRSDAGGIGYVMPGGTLQDVKVVRITP